MDWANQSNGFWRGAYSATVTYEKGDLVGHGGVYYRATAQSLDSEPLPSSANPDWASYTLPTY